MRLFRQTLYPNNLKRWFWAISKLSKFVDLNRLNINNIDSVKIGKLRCFEAAENPPFEVARVITQGADVLIVLALVLLLAIAPAMRHQFLVGTLVNAILIAATIKLGVLRALLLACIPSLFSLAFGFLPVVFLPAAPFIIAANMVMILVFNAFAGYSYWVVLSIGAFVKFLVLFGLIFFLFPIALGIAGYLQIVTALSGGILAFSGLLFLNRNRV